MDHIHSTKRNAKPTKKPKEKEEISHILSVVYYNLLSQISLCVCVCARNVLVKLYEKVLQQYLAITSHLATIQLIFLFYLFHLQIKKQKTWNPKMNRKMSEHYLDECENEYRINDITKVDRTHHLRNWETKKKEKKTHKKFESFTGMRKHYHDFYKSQWFFVFFFSLSRSISIFV